MPFTGGATPSPERYGGGEGNSDIPLVQRIYESLSAARGSAYDNTWPPTTAVGIETMALARAIALDGWGANQRLANNMLPSKASSFTGMLQRWERIFNVPPLPGDPDPVRRARVVNAWLQFTTNNAIDAVTTAIQGALPAGLFNAILHVTNINIANSWWPGGLINPSTNPSVPWYSNVANIAIQLNVPLGYYTLNGSGQHVPNALWMAAKGALFPILDQMLPAWVTWDIFILSTHAVQEFRFDEPDYDLEAFGS